MLSICPQVRNLEVPVEGTRVVTLSIERRAETLPTVQVLGDRMSGGRTGFAQRERMGLRHFVGPDPTDDGVIVHLLAGARHHAVDSPPNSTNDWRPARTSDDCQRRKVSSS